MNKYISYCGLKCKECAVYIATEKDDDEMRTQLAKGYTTEHCAFTKDDMHCKGCFEKIDRNAKMCGSCEIRNCAHGKATSTCAVCESYPCELIEKYVPIGSDNRKTLDELCGR